MSATTEFYRDERGPAANDTVSGKRLGCTCISVGKSGVRAGFIVN